MKIVIVAWFWKFSARGQGLFSAVKNHERRSYCMMSICRDCSVFFTDVLLCHAYRTQTGGQSSESSRLSGAPFLSCPADTGDLHTHENQWVGLESRETERVRQRLDVKQDEEAYCYC